MITIEGADPRLLNTLAALGDYAQDIVLVGGWVPHIYELAWPAEERIPPRSTFDVDVAVEGPLRIRGHSRLDAQLEAKGYLVRFGPTSAPAAQAYHNPEDEDLLDIEFLLPLTGPPGQPPTVQIQEGVVAQRVRYLNILLDNVMDVEATGIKSDGGILTLRIRVPISGAFIYHRGLAFVERIRPQMRAKDLYYIFETWMNHPNRRDDIAREIERIREKYPSSWYSRFRSNLGELFSSDIAAGVLLVSQQYTTEEPEALTHRRIYQAFQNLLRAIPED
jgi:hypothetical protein